MSIIPHVHINRYILLEKRRHLALDPVANFHLRNGACAHRLNWLGDTSTKGMEESFGLMINYLYSLDHIEMNNQQYLLNGTISVSSKDAGFQKVLMDSAVGNNQAAGHGVGDEQGGEEGQVVQVNGSSFRLLEIVTA